MIAMGVLPPGDPASPRRAARSPRRYDDSFRRYAVKRALEPDVRVADVAGELGVSASTLRRWIKAAGDADGSAAAADADGSRALAMRTRPGHRRRRRRGRSADAA